ncbi:hypothetical protein E3N88_40272 [Mikania micrantha]|uniref:Uncharacterized protein n=1 Tax=Mikania micrantha TaxID=192012 RepID=A0A5N6LM96_9ASTR|nr:hypothetical protein E3N88_40272 [Mikania micrantha]
MHRGCGWGHESEGSVRDTCVSPILMPPLLAESAVGGGAPGRLLWWAWMTSKGSRWRKELPTVALVFTHIHTPGCVCSDGNMERLMVAGSWVRTLEAGGGLFEFVAGMVP